MALVPVALFDPSAEQGGTARRRPPYFRTKKLGILGATKALQYTPWHDPSWTLAAHPCCRPHCKREPDWYFDLHRPECFRVEKKRWNPEYHSWLKKLQTPIFMQENWPDVPMAVRYPLERILGEYRAYFTNHVAYMIALAMTEGVTHVGLFGCEYGADTEYGLQRGSCEYWLGRFEQSGGHVVLPPKLCWLLGRPKGLYGYESHDEQGKLVKEYRKPVTVTLENAKGEPEQRELTKIDVTKAEDRAGLMQLPAECGPINWKDSGFKVGEDGLPVARELVAV